MFFSASVIDNESPSSCAVGSSSGNVNGEASALPANPRSDLSTTRYLIPTSRALSSLAAVSPTTAVAAVPTAAAAAPAAAAAQPGSNSGVGTALRFPRYIACTLEYDVDPWCFIRQLESVILAI